MKCHCSFRETYTFSWKSSSRFKGGVEWKQVEYFYYYNLLDSSVEYKWGNQWLVAALYLPGDEVNHPSPPYITADTPPPQLKKSFSSKLPRFLPDLKGNSLDFLSFYFLFFEANSLPNDLLINPRGCCIHANHDMCVWELVCVCVWVCTSCYHVCELAGPRLRQAVGLRPSVLDGRRELGNTTNIRKGKK